MRPLGPSPALDPPPAAARSQVRAAGGRAAAPTRSSGRAAPRSPAGRGPWPGYLLSRQAIHSAEEEAWAACAATMLGSGRSPAAGIRARSPSARCSPLLRPARLPPARLRLRRRSGGRAAGGRGPEGRDVGTGRAQAPALRTALRRPGVGSPASRAGAAGGRSAGTPVANTCDRWPLPLRETWAAPLTSGPLTQEREENPTSVCGEGGKAVSVYIFFIQQMPLKWLLPLRFLRNP